MVFDESEVRKIIVDCKRVLDYLAVSEVIETLEDLVQFVKDMSPCLTKVHMYTYLKHLGRGAGVIAPHTAANLLALRAHKGLKIWGGLVMCLPSLLR